MNNLSICFLGVQETIIIIFMIAVLTTIGGLVLVALVKYIKKPSTQSSAISQTEEIHTGIFKDTSVIPEENRDYFPVKEGSKIRLIRFDEIVDFSADNNFVFLTDTQGRDYVVESNLAELESKLPKDFLRVHKSAIVNSKLIGEVKKLANGRYELIMKCDKIKVISCSKSYNDKIKSIIDF